MKEKTKLTNSWLNTNWLSLPGAWIKEVGDVRFTLNSDPKEVNGELMPSYKLSKSVTNVDTIEKLNAYVERLSKNTPLDNYNNPKTTKEHINELHHILVQTCLNYMKEHELTDIDEISFNADGLSSSYEYNEWTPATDSSLTVVGLQEENNEDNYLVRKIIGESF